MKVKGLEVEINKGMLYPSKGRISEKKENTVKYRNTEFNWIEIKKGRYIQNGTSHPLRSGDDKFYKRMYGLQYKNRKVYWLYVFGNQSSAGGYHVSFNWWEHQSFLLLQGEHWFQKEENIRYIVNLIFLIIGVVIGLKQI